MKTIVLKGDARTGTGKKAAKALRTEGKVPCVVYGKKGNSHFGVYEYDFKKRKSIVSFNIKHFSHSLALSFSFLLLNDNVES